MDPLLVLTGLMVSSACALLIYEIYRQRTATHRIVLARITPAQSAPGFSASSLLRESDGSSLLFRLFPVPLFRLEKTRLELARAGSALRVSEYTAMRLTLALTVSTGAVILVTTRFSGGPAGLPLIVSLAGLIAGWHLPGLYLSYRGHRRVSQINHQLADALTAMAKSLRVGQGIMQAIAYAADETPAPLGRELQTVLRDLQLGAEAENAFADLSARVGSRDLDIAVTAIVIQRTAGGNLSEILDSVARTIRQRTKLHGEVNALTARQRLTSMCVAALPVLVAIAFVTINPKLGNLLLTTTPGQLSLAIGIGFELLGIAMIQRLSRIDV